MSEDELAALDDAQLRVLGDMVRAEMIGRTRARLTPQDVAVPTSPYGYCPQCGSAGALRERRLDGNDVCTNRHTYPSRDALKAVTKATP